MSKIIKLIIADEYITGDGVSIGAVGSHDEVLLELHFSEAWKDTTKRVIWTDATGKNSAITVITPLMLVQDMLNVYQVPVPAEAKKVSGHAGVTIKGVIIEPVNQREIEAISTETAYFRVLENKWDIPSSADVTPSQAEQLQAEIDAIEKTITQSIDASKAAAQSATAAKLSEDNAKISETNSKKSEHNSKLSENSAAASANEAKSWATGGTSSRPGEDTDNAKYYSEEAKNTLNNVYTKNETYTKAEVTKAINDAVFDSGAGDMTKSVYDKDNDGIIDNSWSLSGGSEIAANTDLNTLTEIGNYYVTHNDIAQTLKNCPTTSAFSMKVIDGIGLSRGYKYIVQIITNFTGAEWKREGSQAYDGASWVFRNWIKTATTPEVEAVKTIANNALNNGISQYTQDKNNLTGAGENGKFKATNSLKYTYFLVNGEIKYVRAGAEKEIELAEGSTYIFIIDGDTINFTNGGAVSIPDGKTVTPVDNIKIWQKCAGLQTKYDNINNLLLDSNYVSALMSTDNSIQYMIRSLNIQTSVLSNISVVDILDRTLSFTTPTMTSANTPYGEVTFDRAPDSSWKDFRDDIGSDANYWTGIGGWVQWVHTTPFWMYKFRIYDMYTANNSTIRIDAILEDNSVVELSKNITVYNKKDIIEIMPAHTYKCKGFRIVKVAAPGANDWVNFTKIKAWGKL